MQNKQFFNIEGKNMRKYKQITSIREMGVNFEFENDDVKLSGFNFGLDESDWRRQYNNIDGKIEQNNKDLKQQSEMQKDFSSIETNNIPSEYDEFQSFNIEIDKNNNTDNTDYFQEIDINTIKVQDNKSQQLQLISRRQKLQKLYNSSNRHLMSKKPQSQLQQLIKHNQLSSINKYNQLASITNRLNKNHTRSINDNKSSSNKQQQNEENNYFQLSNDEQQEQQQEFAVFNNNMSSKKLQSLQHYQHEENSPAELTNMGDNFQRNDINYCSLQQTQVLLASQQLEDNQQQQSKTMQQQKHQFRSKSCGRFSVKFIPSSLCIVRVILSLITVIIMSIVYGFVNSIILIIIHDLLVNFLLIKEIVKTNNAKFNFQWNQVIVNSFNEKYSKTIDMDISLNDEITYKSTESMKLKQQVLPSFDQYVSQLRASIKHHKYLKYSLYISSLSLLIFILVQISQIDTFFSPNYFSLSNWWHILLMIFIFTIQLWSNSKLNHKIHEIIFYEDTYIKTYQSS